VVLSLAVFAFLESFTTPLVQLSPRTLKPLLARALPEWVKAPLRGRLFGYRGSGVDLGFALTGSRARAGGLELELPPEMIGDARYHFSDNGSAVEEMHALLREARERGGLLVDVGSHHGLMSVMFCLAAPENRAIGFEPSPPLAEVATRLATLNGLGDRVSFHTQLVGGENGVARTWLDEHRFIRLDPAPAGQGTDETPVRTLDEVCATLAPTVVKIDVEGDELQVLRGAGETLRKHRPVLLLELHLNEMEARGENPREIERILAGLGYAWETSLGRPLSAGRVFGSALAVLRVVARPR
jgi:FkbM family methyltransferase